MNGNKFKVTTQQDQHQVTAHLQGDLDLAAAGEFRSLLESIVNDPALDLTLDLEKLTYIDSTGIGILISVLKLRKEQQAQFRIVHVPQQIQKLFDMTGISKFLTPNA
ncbi:anti-sigma F factor antagonist [Paenibacillus dendritiformis]|uniref:STAS domain-containing protein n=1 Tax=Paenibacillus dendritiformis TaxID=130049 RepID=UPI0018CE7064|nr:STAS domain-containing protein [Paenibacillus dendritiformis]MBG9791910.1 anti-sigma F factor antagonist [Paenibacillus dendritiformis]